MRNIKFLFLISFLWSCTGNGTPGYESTKLSIEEQEKIIPASFLDIEGKYKENLLGETVIEGKLSSSSTIAKYKDVVVNVNFYTKTDTYLSSEEFVVYEFVNPGSEVDFKIKTKAPKGYDKLSLEIIEAKSVD
jgi:hypothetical protein